MTWVVLFSNLMLRAGAKGRLRAKQTRRLFKRAKALRDDAYEAETVAKHALQALMDDKERKRVDELLRSVTRRGK